MKTSSTTGRTPKHRGFSLGEIAVHVTKTMDERLRPLERVVENLLEREREGLKEIRGIVAGRLDAPDTVRNEARITQGALLGEMHNDLDALEKALAALWNRLEPVTANLPKAVDGAAPPPTVASPAVGPMSSHGQGVAHASYRLRHIAAQVQNLTSLLEL